MSISVGVLQAVVDLDLQGIFTTNLQTVRPASRLCSSQDVRFGDAVLETRKS
jgi:hypothetical protein